MVFKKNRMEDNSGSKEVELKITERGLYEEGVRIYKDPLSAVREILQNALDAGATKLEIKVSNEGLIFRDDGKGMSRDFIEKDFSQIGAKFKDDHSGQRGRYGFGRLSYWSLIAKENEDGSISYRGSITIQTRNTIIEWERIDKYRVKEGKEWIEGTKIEIQGAKVDIAALKNYLENILVGDANLEISINGTKIDAHAHPISVFVDQNYFWYEAGYGALKYEMGFSRSNTLIIAENGIRIKSIKLPFKMGGYINFTPPPGVTVTTMSREETTLSDYDIYSAYKDSFIKFLNSLEKEDLLRERHEIVKAAEWFISNAYAKPSDFRNVIVVEVGNKVFSIAELAKVPNVVWAIDKTSKDVIDRAVNLGYTVVIVDSTLIPFFNGLLPYLELSQTFPVRGARSESEKAALEFLERYMPRIRNIADSLERFSTFRALERKTGEVASISEDSLHETSLTSPEVVDKLVKLSEGTIIGGIPVYFSELEDPSIAAFEYQGKICFNVTNPEVRRILDRGANNEGAYLGLIAIFLHEYVHLMGFWSHDGAFASTFTHLVTELLMSIGEEIGQNREK